MGTEMRVPPQGPTQDLLQEQLRREMNSLKVKSIGRWPQSQNVEVQTRAQQLKAEYETNGLWPRVRDTILRMPEDLKNDVTDIYRSVVPPPKLTQDQISAIGGPFSESHKADKLTTNKQDKLSPADLIYDKQAQDFKTAYPGLAEGVSIVQSPDDGSDNKLEFWPPNEEGTKDRPRPAGIPMDKPGVEVFGNKAKTLDIAGDVVSHYGVKNDPTLKAHYDKFVSSITKKQEETLKEQYDWAKTNEGETRPYATWKDLTGLPAYFRGYIFKQWSDKAAKEMYTAEQRKNLDEVIEYITKPPKKK